MASQAHAADRETAEFSRAMGEIGVQLLALHDVAAKIGKMLALSDRVFTPNRRSHFCIHRLKCPVSMLQHADHGWDYTNGVIRRSEDEVESMGTSKRTDSAT